LTTLFSQNTETNFRSFFTSNQSNNILQRHVDNRLHRTLVTLSNRDDLILRLKKARRFCCATLHELLNNSVAVLRTKGRTECIQIKAHLKLKIVKGLSGEVTRMRIKRWSGGIKIVYIKIFRSLLCQVFKSSLVASTNLI